MTSPIPTRAAFLVAALALAGCGPDDVRVKIDASRSTYVDELQIEFCGPQRSCEFGSDPFAGTKDLSATIQVHVPTGHTPVPLAFIYNDSDSVTRACRTANVNLTPDVVEINVAVGGAPSIILACPTGICTEVVTPPDCTSL